MSIASVISSMQTNVSNAYDAISAKGGTVPQNKNIQNLANAIGSISGGGSSDEKTVFLYDPYGNEIKSYTKSEFASLSAYPTPPTLPRLTFQEYNWSLSDAKTFVNTYDKLDIGAIYKPTSEKCEFDIELTKGSGLEITFNLMTGNVNWGDGTSGTISGATVHTYANYGRYTITCDGASLNYHVDKLFKNPTVLKEARLHAPLSGKQVFSEASRLEYVTLSNNCTISEIQEFYQNYSLKALILPATVNTSYSGLCQTCYSLKVVCLSPNMTTLEERSFQSCRSLKRLILPKNFTSINGTYTLNTGAIMSDLIIPNTYTGTTLGSYSLSNVGAQKLIIPSSVTTLSGNSFRASTLLKEIYFLGAISSIAGSVFYDCSNLNIIDFTHCSAVPSLSNSNSFTGVIRGSTLKIIVPDNLYSTWIGATNWTSVASCIYKASEV